MDTTFAAQGGVKAKKVKGIPLYAHVSDLAGTKKPYVLPVPFMNVLNGKLSRTFPALRSQGIS